MDLTFLSFRMFANEGYGLAACRRDRDGNYLIDRSPKYFTPILNYLRTGQLILECDVSAEGVLEEAKYFGLGDDVTQQLEGMVSEAKGVEDNHKPLTRRDVISAIISTDPKSELRFQGTNLAGADLSKLDLRKINFRYHVLSKSSTNEHNPFLKMSKNATVVFCFLFF